MIPYYPCHAFEYSDLQKNIQDHLESNNTYIFSNVTSEKEIQNFNFKAIGLHQQDCHSAMKVIGQYENYQNHVSFITKSTYQNERINLSLSSAFLPFDMVLNFKLPRITGEGTYPFIFDNGFLRDLKGDIYVQKCSKNKKFNCLIGMQAQWSGPKTKIPDYIFEMFTKTIGEIGLSKLFRMSGHRF